MKHIVRRLVFGLVLFGLMGGLVLLIRPSEPPTNMADETGVYYCEYDYFRLKCEGLDLRDKCHDMMRKNYCTQIIKP